MSFPVIPVYLNKQPAHTIGIPGARITHIHCDNRADAEDVAMFVNRKCS